MDYPMFRPSIVTTLKPKIKEKNMTDKIVDIRTRMNLVNKNWKRLPDVVQRGYTVAKKMDEADLIAVYELLGRIVLYDVAQGLKGENTEFLFTEIDKLYEKWQQEKDDQVKTCFFCDADTDVGVCLGCLLKKCGGEKLLKNRGGK